MSTRLYLPSSGAAPVSPAFGSLWDDVASAVRLPLLRTKSGSPLGLNSIAETSLTNPLNLLHRQFVSEPISAGQVSGSFTLATKARESSSSMNASLQVLIRIVSNDGSTVRGTLYAGHAVATNATPGAIGEEFSTAGAPGNVRIIPSTALTPVTAQTGDRIVVAIGARCENASATSFTSGIQFGDASGASDLPLTSGDTTVADPWIEFSQTLNFDATAPTVPTSLAAPSKTATTVDLTWTASTDAVGVAGYGVYVDGVKVGSDIAGTSASVTGLTAQTPYSFAVDAVDAAGNRSAKTSGLPVTTNAAPGGGEAAAQTRRLGAALSPPRGGLARTTGTDPRLKIRAL